MKRQLPTFSIEGTVFLVDVATEAFVQADNPDNRIPFVRMTDHDDHYRLIYDVFEKNYSLDLVDAITAKSVKVPPLIELDPEGMAEKYGCTLDELKGKRDFEIMIDQELMTRRLNGELPHIDIVGQDFIIDVRRKELRAADNPATTISLTAMELSANYEKYTGFYHPATRQLVAIDPTLTRLHDGVVMLEVPGELLLDPVGVALEHGIRDEDHLRRFPVQAHWEARIIPLPETELPALVRGNKAQLKQNRRLRP